MNKVNIADAVDINGRNNDNLTNDENHIDELQAQLKPGVVQVDKHGESDQEMENSTSTDQDSEAMYYNNSITMLIVLMVTLL